MLRQLRPAIVSVLVFAVVCGLAFPLLVTAIARVAFPRQAGGSLIERGGSVIGSELIGQNFTGPGYFHPRPSAAGNGYDAGSSGGTNLGPTSSKLIEGVEDNPATKETSESYPGIKQLAEKYRRENGLARGARVPADAVTRSASGLDPEISPANAYLQAARVARARGISLERLRMLIREQTARRQLGIFGEPRVNVLRLNIALDAYAGEARR